MKEKKLKILLIEDNEADVRLIQRMMKRIQDFSYELSQVGRLDEALRILKKQVFDVVLLDLGLPDNRGFDTFSTLDKQVSDVPIIVLTALDDEILGTQAIRRGAQDYLVKGKVDGNLLVRSIRYAVERKRSEEIQKESDEKYHTLVDNINVGIYRSIPGPKGKYIEVNPTMYKMFGYKSKEEFSKIRPVDIYQDPNDRSRFSDKLLDKGSVTNEELKMKKRDGTPIICSTTVRAVKDQNGNTKYFDGIIEDITKRKQAEEALRESEAKMSSLVNNAPAIITIVDKDARIEFVNQPIRDLKIGDVIGKSLYDVIEPEFHDEYKEILTLIYETSQTYRLVTRSVGKGKVTTWYDNCIAPIKQWDRVVSTVVISTDITERMKSEKKIKRLNAVLRVIRKINQITIQEKDRGQLLKKVCETLVKSRSYYGAWIILLDEYGNLVTTTKAGVVKEFTKMVDLLKEKKLTICGERAIKQSGVITIKDPHIECSDCPIAEKYPGRSGMAIRLEFGSKIYGLLSACVPTELIDTEEERELFEEVAGDIAFALFSIEVENERKQIEKTLRENEAFNFALFEYNPIETIVVNREGRVVKSNKAKRKSGNRLPNIGDVMYKDYAAGHVIDMYTELMESIREREEKVFPELKYNDRILSINIAPFPEGAIITSQDITEYKKAVKEVLDGYKKLQDSLTNTVNALASTVEKRDPYTAGHQQRVTKLACAIAKKMGLSEKQIEGLRISGLLHDIGKVSIPAEILSKPSSLTEGEFKLIKTHPQIAYEVLENIEFPWPVAQIVLQHHEKLDGSGYPKGLSGEEIMIEARILTVSDITEALSSHRPYRPAFEKKFVFKEISNGRGTLLDPDAVDACLELFKKENFIFD